MFNQLQMALFAPPPALEPALSRGLESHMANKNIFAFYSKNRWNKDRFIELVCQNNPGKPVVYLCPKLNVAHIKSRFPQFKVASLESITDKEVFLGLNAVIGRETVVIMENVSRYTVLSSDKFNFLHRIRMNTEKRYLIDIVPFTRHIHKLYLPMSYLDRDILGYSNGYAFEYNYLEQDEQGNVFQAHDPLFIAQKMHTHCWIDYSSFLPQVEHKLSVVTEEEKAIYQNRKTQLFEEYNNPRKIVTELCDCANMLESRYSDLLTLLSSLSGGAVVYTNIVKNNALIKRYLKANGCKAGVRYMTYMTHNNQPIQEANVIFFEVPINQNRVAALDVLADTRPEATVYLFGNNTKADRLVNDEMAPEWQQINELTKALWKTQEGL